jgi:predicted O-methyltransferase YrrM
MDLVFVDGAHSADYVKNDSEKGWEMLRSGGVLVWHDCVPSHAAVVDFVKRSGWPAKRILGTSLAFAVKP